MEGRPGEDLEPLDFDDLKGKLTKKFGNVIKDVDVMSAAMYPKARNISFIVGVYPGVCLKRFIS